MSHPISTIVDMKVQFFETLRLLGVSIGRGPVQRRRMTIFEFTRGHGSVLAQFRAKPGRWVLTAESERYQCSLCGGQTSKYLQFMALEDGNSVVGECVEPIPVDEHHKFTPNQEDVLRRLGWNDPAPPGEPNWFFEVNADSDLVTLDDITHRTLREVFELLQRDLIEVSFYEMVVGDPMGDESDSPVGEDVRRSERAFTERTLTATEPLRTLGSVGGATRCSSS